jgi:hypothetical protein
VWLTIEWVLQFVTVFIVAFLSGLYGFSLFSDKLWADKDILLVQTERASDGITRQGARMSPMDMDIPLDEPIAGEKRREPEGQVTGRFSLGYFSFSGQIQLIDATQASNLSAGVS